MVATRHNAPLVQQPYSIPLGKHSMVQDGTQADIRNENTFQAMDFVWTNIILFASLAHSQIFLDMGIKHTFTNTMCDSNYEQMTYFELQTFANRNMSGFEKRGIFAQNAK